MKKLMAVLISLLLLCGAVLPALAEGSVKDETVYILAAPDGAARRIIVSDWLSNPDGAAYLADASGLTDIENVKGEETFDGAVWQADGRDVYYQGESDAPLPVEMKISFTLDGEAISPEELAGRDGHVTIRFDYSVLQGAEIEVGGAAEEASVPYAVITGALLKNDVFTNISAVNARIINDGDRCFVVGAALPGLQRSLQLDGGDCDFTLPEYVLIEADAAGFALPVTLSIATSEPFAKLDAQKLESADDLKDAVKRLSDGMAQLMDGGAQLSDGLTALSDGADQLADGADALADGLNSLVSNNESLISGSQQVFSALLSAANEQLAAAGADAPELTSENYAQLLSDLIDAMSEEGISRQARAQVEQAVRAQQEQISAAVTEAVQAEVGAQVEEGVREGVRTQVLAAIGISDAEYAAAQQSDALSAEQAEMIEGAVEQQMASDEAQAVLAQQLEEQMASQQVQSLIQQKTEEQVQALIDENMSGADVQQQIAQNVSLYQQSCAALTALKAQLDSYSAFHSGLIAYTEGAFSAADGAAQLAGGIPALLDGIAQLEDGAQALRDGISAFSSEGVAKLDQLVNEDLDVLLARARGLIEAAQGAQNYSGIADDASGALRFIWRTDAVEA